MKTYYQSSVLKDIPKVIHGYSTKVFGDMRKSPNRETFLAALGLSKGRLVMSEQVHGATVHEVTSEDKPMVANADGLVWFPSSKKPESISLGTIVADCVPMLFADKQGRAIGAAHAGWKGTYANIGANVVSHFVTHGVRSEDILVSIGPHICSDCYTVSQVRARQFLSRFGDDKNIAQKKEGIWHVDLSYIGILQLRASGIPMENIDVMRKCTACNTGEFFSYRKDTKESYGEIIGIIGFV